MVSVRGSVTDVTRLSASYPKVVVRSTAAPSASVTPTARPTAS
ncbi:hypothetical protein [Urbifossiella limnaea]|nr:hypothetical protein [Urbifossiella limnaea]